MDLKNRLTMMENQKILMRLALDLYAELIIFRLLVYENQAPLKVLSIFKNSNGSFPNINMLRFGYFLLFLSLQIAQREVFQS